MPELNKLKVKIPVLVEGKYDKARLSGVIDAVILVSNGFGVFRDEERRALIRTLGKDGLIVLCDSDGGGRQIRSHLKGMLGGITVYDLYIPEMAGKEPRKKAPSAAGLLGVEGVPNEVLRSVFERFRAAHPELFGEADGGRTETEPITRALLYELGLNGTPAAAENRAIVAEKLGLPHDMSTNAFYEAVSMLTDAPGLRELMGNEGNAEDEENAAF